MTDRKWLEGYSGQTAQQLAGLEGEYRTDSLVLAFEQAIGQKAARQGDENITTEERVVLVVEALEREVNNGGYSQFFQNSSPEFVSMVVDSLLRIGCPKTAQITQKAVDILGLPNLSTASIETAMATDNDERDDQLNQCDDAYHTTAEDIAGRLFSFIKAKKTEIKL